MRHITRAQVESIGVTPEIDRDWASMSHRGVNLCASALDVAQQGKGAYMLSNNEDDERRHRIRGSFRHKSKVQGQAVSTISRPRKAWGGQPSNQTSLDPVKAILRFKAEMGQK